MGISIKSYAKINLSLDVYPPMDTGMHPVDIVMQLVSLYDEVSISVSDKKTVRDPEKELPNKSEIILTCDDPALPVGKGNLAYRAAELLMDSAAAREDIINKLPKEIRIDIKKNIPLEAGLAGGSGNAAAVLIGLNELIGSNYTAKDLMTMGAELGSDVPFCLQGQLKARGSTDDSAAFAVRAKGTGTETTPCSEVKAHVVLVKPAIGMSTAEVYRGIDRCKVDSRPDNDALEQAIESGDLEAASKQMINVLENYTLKVRPDVLELKEIMKDVSEDPLSVLMSGSGPTVFALFRNERDAETSLRNIKKAISEKQDMAGSQYDSKYRFFICETLSSR